MRADLKSHFVLKAKSAFAFIRLYTINLDLNPIPQDFDY
jgi:hypothetical protein